MLLLNKTSAFQAEPQTHQKTGLLDASTPKFPLKTKNRLASTQSPNILRKILMSVCSLTPNLKNQGHFMALQLLEIPFHPIMAIMARKASSVLRPLGLSKTITSSVAEITGGRRGGNNLGRGSPTSSREA
jgi:hypothetical protein